jgi:hypothetical protein
MRAVALCAGVLALSSVVSAGAAAGADAGSTVAARHQDGDPGAVLAWNEIAVRTDLASGQTNQEGVLHLAYVQAAVFDAVDAIDGGYRPYVGDLRVHGPANADAAVAAAAHQVLVTQFPGQADVLDSAYATALATIPDGPAKARGTRVGRRAATELLRARASDGFEAEVPYTFGSGPGVWVLPTDNPVTTPATPWVAVMQPFVLRRADQYRPGPPPALTSRRYVESYAETKILGSAASNARTPAQTATAQFWGLARPDAQYNEGARGVIAAVGMNRVQAARALALINLVTADAYIACFDAKYTYSAWRPYTAIRLAGTDGNPETVADPAWTPLIKTPNHPEYPANHSCVTTGYAITLDHILGHRRFDVTVSGVPATAQTRHYTSPAQLITEIADARIWGGIHFRYSTDAGTRIGIRVADYDYEHALRPGD